jgi:hypothetical protein
MSRLPRQKKTYTHPTRAIALLKKELLAVLELALQKHVLPCATEQESCVLE